MDRSLLSEVLGSGARTGGELSSAGASATGRRRRGCLAFLSAVEVGGRSAASSDGVSRGGVVSAGPAEELAAVRGNLRFLPAERLALGRWLARWVSRALTVWSSVATSESQEGVGERGDRGRTASARAAPKTGGGSCKGGGGASVRVGAWFLASVGVGAAGAAATMSDERARVGELSARAGPGTTEGAAAVGTEGASVGGTSASAAGGACGRGAGGQGRCRPGEEALPVVGR
jgi:hypothetical protein